MTQEEFYEYWYPARRIIMARFTVGNALSASMQLATMLGIVYPIPEYWKSIKLTCELKQKLIWVDSPHFETILKIIEARNGEYAKADT